MAQTITFAATGIEHTVGGIASANRNVLAALRTLAARHSARLVVRVLHEEKGRSGEIVCYGGDRVRFGLAVLSDLARSSLTVFDHVHLASPTLALPRVRGRFVICAHGSEASSRINRRGIAAFRKADLVLTNSTITLERMRATTDGFTGAVCMLGLPPQFPLTTAPPERPNERPILVAADGSARAIGDRAMLLVGRMDAAEQAKGHRELISVLPRVHERIPTAELVFVGGGTDAQAIADAAAASPAAHHIFITGLINDQMLAAMYGAAFAYVMPSRQEGFGLVYLEAMNQALPCLACRDDGGADVVIDGETGVLVRQPIDRDELATAIIMLLSNPHRARALGVAGWQRLNNHFTTAAHQKRVETALQPLLA
jgi:phosphatidylinositol alpha-1,6-mannosyltransferase